MFIKVSKITNLEIVSLIYRIITFKSQAPQQEHCCLKAQARIALFHSKLSMGKPWNNVPHGAMCFSLFYKLGILKQY